MFRTISMQQLEQLLDGERTFTLLDVREQKEYEAGHVQHPSPTPVSKTAGKQDCFPAVLFCAFYKKAGERFVGKREKHGGGQVLLARAGENSIIIYSKIIYYFAMDNMEMEE